MKGMFQKRTIPLQSNQFSLHWVVLYKLKPSEVGKPVSFKMIFWEFFQDLNRLQ